MRRLLKITMAITGVLAGATVAGVAVGGTLIAGVAAILVWATLGTGSEVSAPSPAVTQVEAREAPAQVLNAPNAGSDIASDEAPTEQVAAATPEATPKTTARASTPRTSTPRRRAAPTMNPTGGDLLADEDEWEALGFDSAPSVPVTETTERHEAADELDDLLGDFAPRR